MNSIGSRTTGRTTIQWYVEPFSGAVTVRATRRVAHGKRLMGYQVQAYGDYLTDPAYRETLDHMAKFHLARTCAETKWCGWFPRRRRRG